MKVKLTIKKCLKKLKETELSNIEYWKKCQSLERLLELANKEIGILHAVNKRGSEQLGNYLLVEKATRQSYRDMQEELEKLRKRIEIIESIHIELQAPKQ
jgi:hypothetical protein